MEPTNDTTLHQCEAWTLSRDSMITDSPDPMSDRTVHVDQYTGKLLADVRYADYSWAGKAMAVGIALHMGTMGLLSVLANTLMCLSVLLLCFSSVVLWWRRRPANAGRLSAPPMPKEMPLWQGAALVGLAVCMAFPMAGLAILSVLVVDTLIVSRLPKLRRMMTKTKTHRPMIAGGACSFDLQLDSAAWWALVFNCEDHAVQKLRQLRARGRTVRDRD